jgi:hypothetical protein
MRRGRSVGSKTGTLECGRPFSSLDQVDRNVDVAARCLGIGTGLIRFLHERLGDFAIDARQVDIEAARRK